MMEPKKWVCKKCKRRHFEYEWECRWGSAENLWWVGFGTGNRRMVACPIPLKPKEEDHLTDVEDGPPEWCPYAVEHLVAERWR